MKTCNTKTVGAIGLVGVVVAGLGGAALGNYFADKGVTQDQVEALVQEAKLEAFEQGVASVEPVVINQTQEVEVEVEKIVKVDNENLQTVLDYVYDAKGNIRYITSGLKDNEVSQIVDRIIFVNEAKALAVQEVESVAAVELHRERVSGVILDRQDIERLRIYDKNDEVKIDNIKFKEQDAIVTVDVRFDHLRNRYKATFEVDIREGEVFRTKVTNVERI